MNPRRGSREYQHPARMHGDGRLEALVAADGLVGPHLIEPLALGVPRPLAELEEGVAALSGSSNSNRPRLRSGRRPVPGGRRVCRSRAQRTSSCQCRLPADGLRRDRLAERREKSASSHSRCWRNSSAGTLGMHVLDELAHRTPETIQATKSDQPDGHRTAGSSIPWSSPRPLPWSRERLHCRIIAPSARTHPSRPIPRGAHADGIPRRRSERRKMARKVRRSHVDRGGLRPGRPGCPGRRVRDGAAFYQEQQPVERRPS